MNAQKKQLSVADQVDNHRRIMFLAMFLLSIIFGIKTTLYLVEGYIENYLAIIAKGVAILFAVVLVAAVLWKVLYIPGNQRHLLMSPDSYVMHIFNKSCRTSWIFTLIAMTLIMITTGKDESEFPTEFYLNLVLFIMLFVFSISFFLMLREGKSGAGRTDPL